MIETIGLTSTFGFLFILCLRCCTKKIDICLIAAVIIGFMLLQVWGPDYSHVQNFGDSAKRIVNILNALIWIGSWLMGVIFGYFILSKLENCS